METIADFILDITENSIRAKASAIIVSLSIQAKTDTITLMVKDNGCGMDEETLRKATEPFYTTKTTRKIGLGLPFLKSAALQAAGTFEIHSKLQIGTTVQATFQASHIDCPPLGNLPSSIFTLMIHQDMPLFTFELQVDDEEIVIKKSDLETALYPFDLRESRFYVAIRDYIEESMKRPLGGRL